MNNLIKSLIGEKTIEQAIQESSARIQAESKRQSIKITEVINDDGYFTGSIFPVEKARSGSHGDDQ